MTTTQQQLQTLAHLRETIQINLGSGKYAIALVAYAGWDHDSAIGDGITSAMNALVTRVATRELADQLADALNDAQPVLRPGSSNVPVYAAIKYDIADYLSRQDERNGKRPVDRQIAKI
jgi:hypothetical protein